MKACPQPPRLARQVGDDVPEGHRIGFEQARLDSERSFIGHRGRLSRRRAHFADPSQQQDSATIRKFYSVTASLPIIVPILSDP
jgi:hypothetical protein